jgi:tetratricopeptide (TPR) repeat protein
MAHNDRNDRRGQQELNPPHRPQSGGRGAPPGQARLDEEQKKLVNALLDTIHDMAQALRATTAMDRANQLAALESVENTAEPAAVTFAEQLGTIRGSRAHDAIEVAQALGELDPRKDVAREARRARLRLRSAGAIPTLSYAPAPAGRPTRHASLPAAAAAAATPPSSPASAPAVDAPAPAVDAPRFVEAYVSQTREQGEVRLIVGWQEGLDAGYMRTHRFVLDFWQEGIKGFTLLEPVNRSRFSREVREFIGGDRDSSEHDPRSAKPDEAIAINWSQARNLVNEALEVNAWRNAAPNTDFARYRTQIDARLLAAPLSDELQRQVETEEQRFMREGDKPYIATTMEPDETVVNWLGAWSFGDFGLAYDLLADDHPLHQQQSRAEYVELRRQWWNAAEPAGLRVTLVRDQEKRASALWVPGSAGLSLGTQRKELEAFWSVVVQETPLGGQVLELPLATISSPKTARHWYWTGYTLVHDRLANRWYISRSRDEGATSQTLTLDELQQRIRDAHQQVEQITTQEAPDPASEAAAQALRGITGALTASLHYADALAVQLPLDESVYQDAITDARTLGNHERAVALIERMRRRFVDEVRLRFEEGIEEYLVAEQYGRQGMAQAEATWLERAIQTVRDVVAEEPTAEHLQGLGELLSRQGHFNQAETYLREAVVKDPTRALAYSDLADALMGRITGENLDDPVALTPDEQQRIAREALVVLGQAGKLDRSISALYTRMGAIYELLHQPDDSIIALQEAIRLDPADADAHYTLGAMLMDRKRYQDALPHFVTAVQLAPFALQARLSLATCYGMLDQVTQALRELDAIDRIQPGLPQVAELRSYLADQRKRR